MGLLALVGDDPHGELLVSEADRACDTCETDTLHLEILWEFGSATRECLTCGDVTDMEGDE